MKALTRYTLAIALVLALSFVGFEARADSPGQMIDEKNAEQDAALKERAEVDKAIGAQIIGLKEEGARIDSELAAERALNAAQSDSLKSLAASVGSLEARVKALEEDEPEPGPDPEPEPADSWPLYLRDLGTGVLTPITGGAITAPAGRYTVQIGESESGKLDAAPFRSTVNGAACGPEREPVYHICGNNNALALNEGVNAVVINAEGNGETKALTITIAPQPPPVDPDPTDPPADAAALMQVGPWFPSQHNTEEPFINLIHGTGYGWGDCGTIDQETGLPVSMGSGCVLSKGVFFAPNRAGQSPTNHLWDGDYIYECVGGTADLGIKWPGAVNMKKTPSRLTFTRNEKTRDHIALTISNITSPCKDIALYRAENEAAFKAGKIYSPKFIAAVSKYDIVRTMDLQSANGAVIRSVDDLATMDALPWSASDWGSATGEAYARKPNPFQGMPIEAALRLGVEANNQVWFQAPITLGAPEPFFNFRPEDDRPDKWAAAFSDAAQAKAPDILESAEWDRYADAFVDALIKSGYPAERPLYISLANEVWNWSGHYFLTTTYAQRMGWGLEGYLPLQGPLGPRESYGAMVARFKVALDAALKRKGRTQTITYVVEGQAAWIELTGSALRGAKAYIEKRGEKWDNHKNGFGVSVASYWGYNEGLDGVDVSNLDALENHFLNGPANVLGTKANIVRLFKGAQEQGAKYGVKLIGAYEGGPHFLKPSTMDRALYEEFIWGERGARVNYEVNKALAEAFPGIILSNYALAGPTGGQPWFEGEIGANNPYANSWDKLIEELGE